MSSEHFSYIKRGSALEPEQDLYAGETDASDAMCLVHKLGKRICDEIIDGLTEFSDLLEDRRKRRNQNEA